MKVNEEIYKNIFQSGTEQEGNIVPLEEALIVNEPELRRELIMNVLNDNPEEYVELLKQARMNEDVEVVHYAITAMVELSKEYDSKLQELERLHQISSRTIDMTDFQDDTPSWLVRVQPDSEALATLTR